MSRQIFIGGTGRSGTTILYKLLGSHKKIFAFNMEMRFIVDYNGIINLVDALTKNYSIVQSREALYHFEKLMKRDMVNKYAPPYIGFNFDEMFGKNFYYNHVDKFIRKLTVGSFIGSDYPIEGNYFEKKIALFITKIEKYYRKFNFNVLKNKREIIFWPRREMKYVRFFANREELIEIVAKFIDDLFGYITRKHNKTMWCEKTPANILHIDFLYELFPTSHFIHIKRDPRGVIYSMQKQFWASNDIKILCLSMKEFYKRWFYLKEKVDLKKYKYLEIKIEDLSAYSSENIEKISNFLGIDKDGFINAPKLSIDKVNYWKKTMSKKDIYIVNSLLGEEIELMGYKI